MFRKQLVAVFAPVICLGNNYLPCFHQ